MQHRLVILFLALGQVFCLGGAQAQTAPRIKATLVKFDGTVLTVTPDGETETLRIGVRPQTRIMRQEQRSLADIAPGSFVGVTLVKISQGYDAQEVHVFPESLRGSGEGLYPATPGSSRMILNGTVTDVRGNSLSIKFRGAGGEGFACTGRASLNPLVGCQGTAAVTVGARSPVLALLPGDKSLLVPGAVLAVSLLAGSSGRPETPGLIVESVATPPVPLPPAPKDQKDAPPPRTSKIPTKH